MEVGVTTLEISYCINVRIDVKHLKTNQENKYPLIDRTKKTNYLSTPVFPV